MAATPVLIPDADILALAEYLKDRPGQIIRTEDLHSRYATLVRATGREPHSQMALGRALNRMGWQRTMLRKSRGGRGRQRYLANSAYVVPGAPPVPVEEFRMRTTLRALMGDEAESAMIRNTDVWEEYQAQARRNGWAWTMNEGQVARWMNQHIGPSIPYGGKRDGGAGRGRPSRYVSRANVERPWL